MSAKSPLQPAGSGRAGATLGLGCAIPFGGVFFCAGCFALWMMTLRPLAQWASSLDWQPTEAVVLSSELAVSDGSDGDTYRIAIRYRYDWPPRGLAVEADPDAVLGEVPAGGPTRAYESDRYDYSHGSTNVGVDDMRAVVRAHPPGARVICFVDPADPASAVIDRGLPLTTWIGLGFSTPFIVAGLGVIGLAWHARRKTFAAASAPAPGFTAGDGETELACAESRAPALIALLFINLFWNGIVSVFVIIAVKEFGNGFIGWFLPVFLTPFVCVGAMLLAGLVRTALRYRIPPTKVWLETARPRAGELVSIRWILGDPAVHRLRVRLRVVEKASGGEDAAEADLHRELLFDSGERPVPAEGRLTFTPPADGLPPALESPSARFVWELALEGETTRRGGFDDRFNLPVGGPERFDPTPAVEPVRHAGEGVALWTAENFAPGDALVFSVERTADAAPEPTSARLGWFIDGPGKHPGAVVWEAPLRRLAPGEHQTVETRLPLAPWSVYGSLFAVRWRLEILDRKRRPLAHADLVVAPEGKIARLRPRLPEAKGKAKSWWRDIGRPSV